jgi:transposase-like protein
VVKADNAYTRDYCPRCKEEAFVDTWDPPEGYDPHMRRFICSGCGQEFYVVVKDKKLLETYDHQLARR